MCSLKCSGAWTAAFQKPGTTEEQHECWAWSPTQSAGSSDLSTNTPGSWRKTSGSYHLTASLVEFHWDKSLSSCAWHDLSSCVMLDVCSLAVHWQPEEGGSVWCSKPGTNVLSSSSIPMPWELLSGATASPVLESITSQEMKRAGCDYICGCIGEIFQAEDIYLITYSLFDVAKCITEGAILLTPAKAHTAIIYST